jgi:hypothetical protein
LTEQCGCQISGNLLSGWRRGEYVFIDLSESLDTAYRN